MLVSALYVVVCRLLELIVLLGRRERTKELEILVLRHELSIRRRQVKRPRFEAHDRVLLRRSAGSCRAARGARSWCSRRRSCAGTARENPNWGYVGIVGELRKLDITVSATSIRNILVRAEEVELASQAAGFVQTYSPRTAAIRATSTPSQ